MLKVGVFGVGHLGKFHLNNWKEIEDVELVGFYDPDEKTATDVAKKYNLRAGCYFDVHERWRGIYRWPAEIDCRTNS